MAAVENQLAFGNEFNDSGRFVNDQRTLLTFGTTPGGTFYATTPRGMLLFLLSSVDYVKQDFLLF